MAVSKRTRFEVLRRDDYTCRYCRSKDNELTIDHVVPVSLGGTDEPANLVAACRDCNFGKSSSSPDASLVEQVDKDAIRWAAAMKRATTIATRKRRATKKTLDQFRECWDSWKYPSGKTVPLPVDWEDAILRQLDSGLAMDDLEHAVRATMTKPWVKTDEFRYFMGVTKNMLAERIEAARALVGDE